MKSRPAKRHKRLCDCCKTDLSKETNVYCIKSNYKWVASYCEKCYKTKYNKE